VLDRQFEASGLNCIWVADSPISEQSKVGRMLLP
jgi:hypothetical protein